MAGNYDVIIVGGGPAGLFAALELCQNSGQSILLIEKGRRLEARLCPSHERSAQCSTCRTCHLVSGLGGAGAFSDGKLTLSSEVGGRLREFVGEHEAGELIHYVDSVYGRFGASGRLYVPDERVDELKRRATLAGLRLYPFKLRHLGTEHSRQVLKNMLDFLGSRVDIRVGGAAEMILSDDRVVKGIRMNGEEFRCRHVILAPGREGAEWLEKEARRLGLSLKSNPIDVGVRVEVPAPVTDELTSALYEAKLEFFSPTFQDRVRTFCMCPRGEVIMESTGGPDPVTTVNGNSYVEKLTDNTNFAILVSTTFTEPFREPVAYGKYLARLANILSGGVLVQRLGDLLEGRRSTPSRIRQSIVEPTLKSAVPGDLSFALPYRHLKDIIEMLQALDKLGPGIASPNTLLYGIEVKFYSCQLALGPGLETEIANMFACGDGAGVSRGLVQASASGVMAAREILRRLGK
ncbi:MAG: NAD(P)/FAD-dependent oxidoreductase [Chloroflexota bacterium]